MTRDEIVQIAWDVGLFMRSHKFQDEPTKLEQFAERIAAEKEQQMIRDGYRKCAEGQRTTQFCGLLDAAVKAEREKVAAWMRSKSYATGHGDTIEDLLKELEWQVAEREREACAKECEDIAEEFAYEPTQPDPWYCAEAIRARGET